MRLWINNINSEFLDIISAVQQGSIVRSILFNCFLNDFFCIIKAANAQKLADDDTLTAIANRIQ